MNVHKKQRLHSTAQSISLAATAAAYATFHQHFDLPHSLRQRSTQCENALTRAINGKSYAVQSAILTDLQLRQRQRIPTTIRHRSERLLDYCNDLWSSSVCCEVFSQRSNKTLEWGFCEAKKIVPTTCRRELCLQRGKNLGKVNRVDVLIISS